MQLIILCKRLILLNYFLSFDSPLSNWLVNSYLCLSPSWLKNVLLLGQNVEILLGSGLSFFKKCIYARWFQIGFPQVGSDLYKPLLQLPHQVTGLFDVFYKQKLKITPLFSSDI